jgi:hypothetical protein
MIAEFERHLGEVATVRFSQITAGALVRRHVRSAFDQARIRGAEVEVHEQRGLVESMFSVRMRGTAGQLVPSLRYLAALFD